MCELDVIDKRHGRAVWSCKPLWHVKRRQSRAPCGGERRMRHMAAHLRMRTQDDPCFKATLQHTAEISFLMQVNTYRLIVRSSWPCG